MARTRNRRIRSPHPGVILTKKKNASGTVSWRARVSDPDKGTRYIYLNRLGLTNEESRTNWAKRKSKQILRRRAQIEAGEPPESETPLSEAVGEYFEDKVELREKTVRTYRRSLGHLEEWAGKQGVHLVEEITGPLLMQFRVHLIKMPFKRQAVGGRRGGRRETGKRRSGRTINRDLQEVRTFLNYQRKLARLPRLNRDDINDVMENVRAEQSLPKFLRGTVVRQLLQAAFRHDAETFQATRAEHRGERAPGATPRYEPISPFLAAVLLTGCRLGEALRLRWNQVDLEAEEIRLEAGGTKTGRERVIDLPPTPALLQLLRVLSLQSGGDPYVFGGQEPMTEGSAKAARRRLLSRFGAPEFTWQDLRRTCGTYLTCAPGIYGAASDYLSSERLGHSLAVAKKHYLRAVTDVPRDARTLEDGLGIDDLLQELIRRTAGREPDAQPQGAEAAS